MIQQYHSLFTVYGLPSIALLEEVTLEWTVKNFAVDLGVPITLIGGYLEKGCAAAARSTED